MAPIFAVPLALKVGAGLLGAGTGLTMIQKAGQRKEIENLINQSQILGDPTNNFGYGTGFGPGMFGPTSGYQAQLGYQTQMGKQQRENMIKNLLAIEPITDRAKSRDFERNMAAARFRTQLGTQQGLTLQGQMGAQALAQKGMGAAGQALTSNYQYQ